eukprot:TRINITY_DN212_c0_g1_i1.p2 TRINITY_DN212_c0_g1~~TRINITY_DN212_c0_g1_i1.p2  ORF type:complete len:146 (-),score=16.61 TRINITY_DN212_c0_g1_i1:50-487(-)
MREFFRGWRRKVGCLTLMMALVLMGMWMRSRNVVDILIIQSGLGTCTAISGGQQAIVLFGDSAIHHIQMGLSVTIDMQSEPFALKSFSNSKRHYFLMDRSANGLTIRVDSDRRVGISYSLFAFPLALLSAYLILWKPRKRVKQDA